MDGSVLKDRDVDVLVEDIDNVMLIDLVLEYLEKAHKENIACPNFPTFWSLTFTAWNMFR